MVGLKLVRTGEAPTGMAAWKERLGLAKRIGFAPRSILDGGAFKGCWARKAASLFPGAQILVVEPNPQVLKSIEANLSDVKPAPTIINAALGDAKENTRRNVWTDTGSDTGASLLSHVSGEAGQSIDVEVETIESIESI